MHPQSSGPTIPDNATGMYACYGILGALYERERTGRGRRVEVNMLEAGDRLHPRSVRELHPSRDPERSADAGRGLPVASRSAAATASCSRSTCRRSRNSSRRSPRRSSGPICCDDERFATRDLRIKNYGELTRVLARDRWHKAARRTGCTCWKQTTCRLRRCTPSAGRARRSAGARISERSTQQHHPTEGEITAIHRPMLIDGGRDGVDLARADARRAHRRRARGARL